MKETLNIWKSVTATWKNSSQYIRKSPIAILSLFQFIMYEASEPAISGLLHATTFPESAYHMLNIR